MVDRTIDIKIGGDAKALLAAIRESTEATVKLAQTIGAQLSQAGVQTNRALASLDTAAVKLGKDVQDVTAGVSATSQSVSKLQSGVDVFNSLSSAARNFSDILGFIRREIIDDIFFQLRRLGTSVAVESLSSLRGAKFQAEFADVRKTVEGTSEELAGLRNEILALGGSIAVTLPELTAIAAEGGKLGIPINEIAVFTRLAAESAVAFDVSAGEISSALGNLRNVFGLATPELRLFADQINFIADRTNSSERELLQLINRVGGSAQRFGLLRSETLALSAAILSLGKQPEVAGTAINRLLQNLQGASTGTDDFKSGLKALGFDFQTIEAQIRTGPNEVLTTLLKRLSGLDSFAQTRVLKLLIGDAGESKEALGDLVLTIQEYIRLQDLAKSKEASGSVGRTFAEQQRTVNASLQLLVNSLERLAIVAAEAFLPAIQDTITGVQGLVDWFRKLNETFPDASAFLRILGIVAPITALVALLGSAAGKIILISAAITAFATSPLAVLVAAVVAATFWFNGFAAGLTRLGPILLRLAGGWIGVAISALVLLGVKLAALMEQSIEFGGIQTTLGAVVSASWDVIESGIGDTIDAIRLWMAGLVAAMSEGWNRITGSATESLDDISHASTDTAGGMVIDWKSAANAILAAFTILTAGITKAFDAALDALDAKISAFKARVVAFGEDIGEGLVALGSRGLGGNLSFDRFDAASRKIENTKGVFQSFVDTFKAEAENIGTIDFIGEFLEKVRDKVRGGVEEAAPDERRGDFNGNSPPFAGEGDRGGRAKTERQAEDDARQEADALIKIKIDEIDRLAAIVEAGFRFELAQTEAAAKERIAFATDNQVSILAIEGRLAADRNDIEMRRAEAARSFAEERLRAELFAKEQELALSKDRGEQAGIGAEIARIEGEIVKLREISGFEAQQLAVAEHAASAERAASAQSLLQQTIDKYDELAQAQREFALEGRIIAESNLPLERKLELLDKIGEAYRKVSDEANESLKRQQEITENAARNIQGYFSDFLFDGWQKGLDQMVLSFSDTIRRIITEALAADILAALGLGGKDNTGGNLEALASGVLKLFGGEEEVAQLEAIQAAKTAAVAAGEAERTGIVALNATEKASAVAAGATTEASSVAASEVTKVSATTGGQAAQTGAVAAGEAARGTIEKAGALASLALNFKKTIRKIHNFAADAAAGAYSAMADIPIVGPVLGAIAAAATYVAVLAFGALTGGAFFAEGGRVAGPGGPRDDRIQAFLSNNEYVVRAEAVANLDRVYGTGFLDYLNRFGAVPNSASRSAALGIRTTERITRFAEGGRVSAGRGNDRGQQQAEAAPVSVFNFLDKSLIYQAMADATGTRMILNVLTDNPSAGRAALQINR